MTEHQRTGVTARSGDTHVIDPTQENAVAVNIEQIDRAASALPSRLREGLGEGVSRTDEETDPPLTPPASGRGSKASRRDETPNGDSSDVAADPITPNAE